MFADTNVYLTAFAIGLIPTLFWLWFWLRQDKKNPEPPLLVAISFIAGMAVVPLALPLQEAAMGLYQNNNLVLVWAAIEEVLKYLVALVVILWNKDVDEPLDPIIYMIAIALGFAALENTLFVFHFVQDNDFIFATVTGSFRFLGSTLLHLLASAAIGVALALSFYSSHFVKILYSLAGLFIAVLLHALFNFFIMNLREGEEDKILLIFLGVWIGIIILFLLFEKVKKIKHTSLRR